MKCYRDKFAQNPTPKMHLLECHVVPFIKNWGIGMGLMGEQGAESIHASINTMTRRFKNIRNKEKQLLQVIKEHHLLISPTVQDRAPQPKRRKRKND